MEHQSRQSKKYGTEGQHTQTTTAGHRMSDTTIIDPATGTQVDMSHGEMILRIGRRRYKGTIRDHNTKQGATKIMVQRWKKRGYHPRGNRALNPCFTRRFQQPWGNGDFQMVCHRCLQNGHLETESPTPTTQKSSRDDSIATSEYVDSIRTTSHYPE